MATSYADALSRAGYPGTANDNAGTPSATRALNGTTSTIAMATAAVADSTATSDLGGTINYLLHDVLGLTSTNNLVTVTAHREKIDPDTGKKVITINLDWNLGALPQELLDHLPSLHIGEFDFPDDIKQNGTIRIDLEKKVKGLLDGAVDKLVDGAVGDLSGFEHGIAAAGANALKELLKAEIVKPLSGPFAESLADYELPDRDTITGVFGDMFDSIGSDYFKLFVPEIAKTFGKLGLSEILSGLTSGLAPNWATAISSVTHGVVDHVIDNVVNNYFGATDAVSLFDGVKFDEVFGNAIAHLLIDFDSLDKKIVDDILGIDGHDFLSEQITALLNDQINGLVEKGFTGAIDFLSGDFKVEEVTKLFENFASQFGIENIQHLLGSFLVNYAGTELAKLVVDIDSLPEALAAQLGTYLLSEAVGGAISGAISSVLGDVTATAVGGAIFNGLSAILGAGIGAIAGSVIFDLLDNLFDGAISGFFNHIVDWIRNDSPQAFYAVHFDPAVNEFVFTSEYSKDSNDQMRAAVKALSDAFQSKVEAIIDFVGQQASFDAGYDNITTVWGKKHFDSKYAAYIAGNENAKLGYSADPATVVNATIGSVLHHMNFHSGNAIMSAAFDMWKAQIEAHGGGDMAFSSSDAFSALQALIGLAKFANDYRQDPTLYDELMAGDTAVGITILQQYFEAQSLGFNDPTTLYGHIENREEIGSAGAGDTIVLDGIAWKATARGGDDTVYGGDHNDLISGGTGNDLLYGNVGADTIAGDEGNDTIYGGVGADTLSGGTGDDVVTGDADDDLLNGDAGNDKLYGGDGSDHLIGGVGNDLLQGDSGDDLVEGGDGADQLFGFDGKDTLNGGDGDDLLNGEKDDDQLNGNAGNDQLDGGAGQDTMAGGTGDDTYLVDDAGDKVIEKAGEGTDRVLALVDFSLAAFANVENLTLLGSAIRGTGNAEANTLTGNALNNVLDGGAGADTLVGGLGDDTYLLDNAGDKVVEKAGEGTDTIMVGFDYSLAALANVENLTLTGSALRATGNAGANTLTGNALGNVLDGAGGGDVLIGGAGNDIYYVRGAGDRIVEGASEGANDIALAFASFALTADAQVERLAAADANATTAINLTGNAFAHLIQGNNGTNVLTGGSGADTLYGYGGNDRLDGGLGADTLYGGLGDDVYVVDTAADKVVENAGEGVDTIEASITFDLTTVANIENLTLVGSLAIDATGDANANVLTGNGAANALNGAGGNDTLYGGGGNDRLDGGIGTDTMYGGTGDDTYVIDSAGDKVVENAGEGSDTIMVGFDYSLAAIANVENLTLTGSALRATGNAGANVLTGNDLANVLDGAGGGDTLAGGKGNDIYYVRGAGDRIVEGANEGVGDIVFAFASYVLNADAQVERLSAPDVNGTTALDLTGNAFAHLIQGNNGANRLTGGSGADNLYAYAGNDRLDGGQDADNLYGGLGDDVYVVDNAGDKVFENAGEGMDTVEASVSFDLSTLTNVENLTLTGGQAINATGNALDNVIRGNNAANTLNGGGGSDMLYGGGGDDIYVVGDMLARVVENAGEGIDTIQASIGYSLAALANVERLELTGTANISATGNSGANTLIGNAGNNLLDGNGGGDVLIGGAGNDLYYARSAADVIVEGANGGTSDIVLAFTSFSLTADAQVERLAAADANANTAINLVGNNYSHLIQGSKGANTIVAGNGADTLMGYGGNDTLYGLGGADTFVFEHGTGRDVVMDFLAGTDRIDLKGIGYSWAQVQAAMQQTGADLSIDLGGGDTVVLHGVTAAQLHQADFLL